MLSDRFVYLIIADYGNHPDCKILAAHETAEGANHDCADRQIAPAYANATNIWVEKWSVFNDNYKFAERAAAAE